jgi:S1-C subfamily serine protease
MDDDDFDTSFGGAPLPPDDRLWRHPSEVRWDQPAQPRSSRSPSAFASPPKLLAVAGVAGLVGATLALGVVAALHGLDHTVEHTAVERVPVSPASLAFDRASDRPTLADLAVDVAPAVVRVVVDGTGAVAGSGIVFRDDGYVLTSALLVGRHRHVAVATADGTELDATVVGTDEASDVAVIRIEGDDFASAVLGVDVDVRVGDQAVAIGAPTTFPGSPFVSLGVVSALGRTLDTVDGATLHGLIQTDVPVKATSAGGPLCDMTGSVIGMTTPATDAVDEGLGYAVPIELAMAIAHELVEHGEVRQVWLGIEGGDLTSADRDRLHVDMGALVDAVVDGSPAATAGLTPDDVIVAVDGESVDTMSGLLVALRVRHPGDTVTVEFVRAGERRSADITLVERVS